MIQEMERLGMIVDVSHLSDGGFWDVYRHTEKPFVASHSNAASVQNVCRNLTDEMIKALGERGGVCGLNYCMDFLTWEAKKMDTEQLLGVMAEHVRHTADIGGVRSVHLAVIWTGSIRIRPFQDVSFCSAAGTCTEKERLP